uniref:Uncharacterized protein n=1 Tax=Ficus carica TaxID=3494 RepID=A0AA88EAI3_FICCA|nr:hypothetical protein TIFTF001_053327 [Ficus carica]GMN70961.1 hypothetical protein TIFTF001_053330 [Ficus carica]
MPPVGIVPSKSLKERFRYLSAVHLLRLAGIIPDMWFPETSKLSRFFRSPRESGRFPSRELLEKFINRTEKQAAICGNSLPLKLFDERSIS